MTCVIWVKSTYLRLTVAWGFVVSSLLNSLRHSRTRILNETSTLRHRVIINLKVTDFVTFDHFYSPDRRDVVAISLLILKFLFV